MVKILMLKICHILYLIPFVWRNNLCCALSIKSSLSLKSFERAFGFCMMEWITQNLPTIKSLPISYPPSPHGGGGNNDILAKSYSKICMSPFCLSLPFPSFSMCMWLCTIGRKIWLVGRRDTAPFALVWDTFPMLF